MLVVLFPTLEISISFSASNPHKSQNKMDSYESVFSNVNEIHLKFKYSLFLVVQNFVYNSVKHFDLIQTQTSSTYTFRIRFTQNYM